MLADGHTTPEAKISKLYHRVQEPALTVNMVPELANQYLLIRGKFLEVGHVSICDGDKVKIYYGRTTKTTVSEKSVIKV